MEAIKDGKDEDEVCHS